MADQSAEYPVRVMCWLLGVSASGYYRWLGSSESRRSRENLELVEEMRKIHELMDRTYGSPRMHEELCARGYCCGRHRVARLMRKHEIIAKMTVRFRRLTKAGKRKPAADNILDRKFQVSMPNRVWASDITYIKTAEGHLYLAVVLDLYSRQVVGWGMSSRLNPDLVIKTLCQAMAKRDLQPGLLHHSDRDTLYSCDAYQWLLSENGIECSMSRKGNCYDNACVESFFSSLKNEYVSFERFRTREEAQLKIFSWIEVFYNRIRRHSTLGYVSPVYFEIGKAYASKSVH
ncbi:MAG: IS3 family transposase [Deltaproteobacteria bacterium]|nr:IS3 family transposase [Deltaproteobacteria bacterium]